MARRPSPTPRTRWQTFRSWHGQEKLWLDIYTRTASALIVILVVYLFAVISGYIQLHAASVAALALSAAFTFGIYLTSRALRLHHTARGAVGMTRLRMIDDRLLIVQAAATVLFLVFGVLAIVHS